MLSNRCVSRLASFAFALAICAVSSAAATVEMVLLAEQNPATSTNGRKWVDLLTGLGVGQIQIRIAQPGEKLAIDARGTKEAPAYRVTGKLAGSQLIVPGGQFTLSDRTKLSK